MLKKIIAIAIITYLIYSTHEIFISKNLPRITPKKEDISMPIPSIVHRTWHTLEINKKMFDKAHKRWIDMNPGFTFKWYDINDCRKFMKYFENKYKINVHKSWEKLKPLAYKSDLWRLCILYDEGGVYIDADSYPFLPIQEMTKDCFKNSDNQFIASLENKLFILPCTGVHNGFIISTPRNKILLEAINIILDNVENERYFNCDLEYTGPVVLKNALINIYNKEPIIGDNKNYYLFYYSLDNIYKNKKKIISKKFDVFYSSIYKKLIKNNWSKMAFNKDIYY